ncbi:hypothetical protein FJ417_28725 [Mesorhizobium sp. B3-1-7]|nr:hypothetical protein FJ417_28725 [Mesorhizobium sp. B3-1-7]
MDGLPLSVSKIYACTASTPSRSRIRRLPESPHHHLEDDIRKLPETVLIGIGTFRKILRQHRQHDLQILLRFFGPHRGDDAGAMGAEVGAKGCREIVDEHFSRALRASGQSGPGLGALRLSACPLRACAVPAFVSHGWPLAMARPLPP